MEPECRRLRGSLRTPERGRRGGGAFVTSIGGRATSLLMRMIVQALLAADPSFRPGSGHDPVGSADRAGLAEMLAAAGFRDVRVETASVPWLLADPADFWQRWALSAAPVAAMMSAVSEPLRAAAGSEFARLIESEFEDRPVVFPTEVLIGLGVR